MYVTLGLIAAALAQDAVSLDVVKVGQVGTVVPSLTVKVNRPVDDLQVKVDCGAVHAEKGGRFGAGEALTIELPLPAGSHRCSGRLTVVAADEEGEMPLSFPVSVLPALGIKLQPGSLDLKEHRLTLVLDRRSSKVEIQALGLGGAEVGGGIFPTAVPAGTPIVAEWSAGQAEVLKLKIRGFDENGFWSELELVPWSYTIPHEDVVFATNLAVIDPAEEAKLKTALEDARGVLDKYGKDVIIKLYVGGHTDTVGDSDSNQELSEKRARAIAEWFKKNGFPGEIFYQGYGEGDLAVPTPDNTDEAKNRRAAYILAARSPEAQGGSGDYGWTRLR